MIARIWIFESEIRAIAEETLRWDTETGGDLFGYWSDEPTILLATRLGPSSQRGLTECRFDLPYLEQIGTTLAVDWGLRYFGDWHSHGRSDVTFPSRTDRNRIGHLIQRNCFERLIEFIATKPLTPSMEREIAIHGYDFPLATWYSPSAVEVVIVPGVSPVREILSAREEFTPCQDWLAWRAAPLSIISGVQHSPTGETEIAHCRRDAVARRAMSQLVRKLEDHFHESVVDQLVEGKRRFSIQSNVARIQLVFDADWPFPLRHVTREPATGSLITAAVSEKVMALQPAQVVEFLRRVTEPGHNLGATLDATDHIFGSTER